MPKVRVGFIGAGTIAGRHARACNDNPIGELHAVADIRLDFVEARAREWGAECAYTDYRELFSGSEVRVWRFFFRTMKYA